MGGIWERMFKDARVILYNLLGEQILTDETLSTCIALIGDTMNSRPITPTCDDIDSLEALCPNDILRPKTLPNGLMCLQNDGDRFRKKWRQVQCVGSSYWRRWKKQYLPLLQLRTKWAVPQRSLKVGDLVILNEDNFPRCYWPMGRVIKIHPDQKGVVRSFVLRTRKGEYVRPVHKMCLLEGVD